MERWRVRTAIRGADGFDARGFLPRLFAEELAHLDATFEDDPDGVVAVVLARAPDAEAAGQYVEGRVIGSLRKRGLPWIATILGVTAAPD